MVLLLESQRFLRLPRNLPLPKFSILFFHFARLALQRFDFGRGSILTPAQAIAVWKEARHLKKSIAASDKVSISKRAARAQEIINFYLQPFLGPPPTALLNASGIDRTAVEEQKTFVLSIKAGILIKRFHALFHSRKKLGSSAFPIPPPISPPSPLPSKWIPALLSAATIDAITLYQLGKVPCLHHMATAQLLWRQSLKRLNLVDPHFMGHCHALLRSLSYADNLKSNPIPLTTLIPSLSRLIDRLQFRLQPHLPPLLSSPTVISSLYGISRAPDDGHRRGVPQRLRTATYNPSSLHSGQNHPLRSEQNASVAHLRHVPFYACAFLCQLL